VERQNIFPKLGVEGLDEKGKVGQTLKQIKKKNWGGRNVGRKWQKTKKKTGV